MCYEAEKRASNLAFEMQEMNSLKALIPNCYNKENCFSCCAILSPIKKYTMAKQRGIFKAEGTLDDITFYKSKDGYLLRQKGGVSAERIATDPAFERTRENQKEFARAGSAGKVLRSALRSLLINSGDRLLVSRLFTAMMKVVKADATSDRGQRNVLDGELELLEGFEFNEAGKLTQTLFAPFTASIDRASGAVTIQVPAFVPVNMIATPAEATHYKIVSAGGFIDFTTGASGITTAETAISPIGSDPSTVVNQNFDVGAGNTQPLFLVLGISFYQEVNGKNYPLKNGAYNALSIVKVDGGA